jgi:hypothetical protein
MKDKLLPKSHFPLILGCSALLIAICAAFFSVYGIATLFAGASISAMVMASSLEIGKLVGTTFLYRYWSKCTVFLKTYLVGAIFILMLITSLGIFGYLSAAFQKSYIEFGVTQEKITDMQEQKTYYHDKIDAAKKRINDLTTLRASEENRMSQVLTNEYIARNPIQLRQLQQQNVDLINDTDNSIKDENDKIQESIDGVAKIDSQINEMNMGTADKKDVQTFKFVADALKLPLDTVARWFILFIICVFDPLAICLILAYNVAVYKKEDETVYDKPTRIEPPIEPSPMPDDITLEPIPIKINPSPDTHPIIKKKI